ncbi:taste receptor type 1 member 3 [Diretmus argenteus]
MSASFKLLVLCWAFGLGCSLQSPEWFHNISTNLFNLSGDILLGGLFPINQITSNLTERVEPGNISCNSLNKFGLGLALVMKYSVDEINANQTLLPGIKLGYEIFDTCRQSAVIVEPTLSFLTEKSTGELPVKCNYTDYETRVAAVIGPYISEMVSVIAKLLGFFLMPQISYGATSEKFSDKLRYPSFLRTVPSDKLLAEAMVHLMKKFRWNWVAVVGSEDEYGQEGQRQFSKRALNMSICVAYEGTIPMYSDAERAVNNILNNIKATKVGVVVLFCQTQSAEVFFKEVSKAERSCLPKDFKKLSKSQHDGALIIHSIQSDVQVIKRNMTGVWVASTTWAIHNRLSSLPNIHTVGTIIGFTYKTQTLQLLTAYTEELFTRLDEERTKSSPLAPESGRDDPRHPCPQCWNLSREDVSLVMQPAVQRIAFSVYAAIYSVAQGLHTLLGCNTTACMWGAETKIYPWQIPLSACSPNCGQGQVRRVKGSHSCCFDCINCMNGTFQAKQWDTQCTKCPVGQWSLIRSTKCTKPTFDVLSWGQSESLGMMLAGAVLLICQGSVGVVFLKHHGTPLVSASGGALGGVALLSLMGGCLSLLLFLAQPGDIVCRLQLPLTSIFHTVALSTIMAISLQIIYVTELEKAASHLDIMRSLGGWLLVLACCGVQAGFCGWFVQNGPSLSEYLANMNVDFVRKFLSCPMQPPAGFVLMQCFNCTLAFISFMCTFMAAEPVRQYNLARDITFSTLIYCVIWLIFVPVYTGLVDELRSIAHVSFSLGSSMGLVAAYYFPKCHLLLRKPELNTSDYFRTFLEGIQPPQEEQQPEPQPEPEPEPEPQPGQ